MAAATSAGPAAADRARDQRDVFTVTRGDATVIDGVLGAGEWNDATAVAIEVAPDWRVTVRCKRDGANLYVAFENVKPAEDRELYPEILVHPAGDAGTSWGADDRWLHISYNDCEGRGEPNVWKSCRKTHTGWSANNFPLTPPGVIEAELSLAKLGLDGQWTDDAWVAFNVTDTDGTYHFWPADAKLDAPVTWSRVATDG